MRLHSLTQRDRIWQTHKRWQLPILDLAKEAKHLPTPVGHDTEVRSVPGQPGDSHNHSLSALRYRDRQEHLQWLRSQHIFRQLLELRHG